MNTGRREFIRTTGVSALGLGILPAFTRFGDFVDFHNPALLPRMTPESQGVSSAAIRSFIAAAKDSGLDWHSFMLLRHGNVIAEGWWKPFDSRYKHTLYSLSKSFTSSAIGFLADEGKITVDDPVTSFFKDDLPATISDNLAKMKIKHLLTMNSGHAEDTMGKMRESQDKWTKTFLSLPLQHEPGTHFLYNTGATYMLGAIVHKVTGQKLEDFLKPRLFQPLGITGYDWEVSPQGLNTAGYGLRVKTEDIARFGQLYLQKGKWDGKQLLTEKWVEEATRYQTPSQVNNGDWSQGYGYQFWRCTPGFYRGDGAFGQFCIVMPEQDAVLAITSESWNMQKSMTTIWQTILPGIQTGALSENPGEHESLKNELKNLWLGTPKGSVSSPSTKKYDAKKIRVQSNPYGVTDLKFKFSNKGCSFVANSPKGETTYQFGWESWIVGADSAPYLFPAAGRFVVPSKTAGTATWIDENTLQMNLRFVEAIHGDKITVKFDGDKVDITFLNSTAENTKTNPELRTGLSGTI